MLLQRKIGKYLAKLDNSPKSKSKKIKNPSKCYVKLIRTWSTRVTLALVTFGLIILVFYLNVEDDDSLQIQG